VATNKDPKEPRETKEQRERGEIRKLPMMPIREMVIFPYMMTPFIVGRESSVRALEEALAGDVALIEAWEADRWGNLTYRSSARNFNPVMAMAATLTIAQAQHIVDLGTLDPEKIATPGIYVNRVLHVPYGEPTVT